jgi:hypothetical protein
MIATAATSINPVLSTGKHYVRLEGMDGDYPDFRCRWETVGKLLPPVLAGHLSIEATRPRTDVYIGLCRAGNIRCHRFSLRPSGVR